jgi:hypothetical protein
VHSLSARL